MPIKYLPGGETVFISEAQDQKKCVHCKQWLSFSKFYVWRKGGKYKAFCKACAQKVAHDVADRKHAAWLEKERAKQQGPGREQDTNAL